MDQGDEPKEEAKEASVDAESTAQSTEDSSSSRSFDCTFCKRGFSNAQALGGHMNIHRKERARLKPVRTAAAIEPFDESWYSYSRNQSFPPAAFPTHKKMYLPESTSGAVTPYSEDTAHRRRRPQELRFFGPEASSGPRVRDDAAEVSQEEREEGEVDLELRLGH